MITPEAEARLRTALVSAAGGYLRNPLRQANVTCAVCTTPVDGFRCCFSCNAHRVHAGLADAVAPLTYAVGLRQSGYIMRGYKAKPPVEEHRRIVAMLLILALSTHTGCAGVLLNAPVTHWTTVPSLPARSGEHPLHQLVKGTAPGTEIPLVASPNVADPRSVNPDHYTAHGLLPRGSHVLVMDDTWARGGHAQSAALALRRAGAARVSVLVVARWINEGFADNRKFLVDLADRDFDPLFCPWTGETCPDFEGRHDRATTYV
ncbi:hypothetical protein [Actinoallomurus sp. CA-150999]|uniref:hypothetical protein n=1 Tax=Actinoallomurus sp. CA-150999 TaxID=3239887 RepID=UPI003D92B86C